MGAGWERVDDGWNQRRDGRRVRLDRVFVWRGGREECEQSDGVYEGCGSVGGSVF